MIIGTAAMLPLGYSLLASVLIASCFASHTLVALPLLNKLGIMRTPTVTTTLGGNPDCQCAGLAGFSGGG